MRRSQAFDTLKSVKIFNDLSEDLDGDATVSVVFWIGSFCREIHRRQTGFENILNSGTV